MGFSFPDNDAIAFFLKKYRNLLIAGLLTLILMFMAISAFTNWFGDWMGNWQIRRWQSNINALANDANQINANLANLNIQNSVEAGEVNALNANHEQARNATNAAQKATNRAEQNLNAVEHHDYNGSTLDQANRARCRAFPDRPECHQ